MAKREGRNFSQMPLDPRVRGDDKLAVSMTAASATEDTRLVRLRAWTTDTLCTREFAIAPASADASFRRYFRISPGAPWHGHATLIAMDAPPPMEDCRPFVHVAQLLASAGLNAPEVLAADHEHGFLLVTDLGTRTYLAELDAASAPALYSDAIDALIRWQHATRDGALPEYDEALLARELHLFPDWYVAKHLNATLSPAQQQTLAQSFRLILDNNLAQPRVFVHRDYHSRNLMVCDPNPGILDFQDAVTGPITYDLVSLLRDAYVEWDEERQIDWAVRYWERARKARLAVAGDFSAFWRDFEWMGVQRQLKVLGIFARLGHRDGKTAYLDDMPRVLGYLRGACKRYRALGPLGALIDEIAGRPPAVVERTADRQSCIPTEYAGELPTTQYRIGRRTGVGHKSATFADRELPDSAGIDGVLGIEVGRGVAIPLADGIEDESGAEADRALQRRYIIQRMGEGVVEIEGQAFQALPSRKGESIVVGIGDGAPGGEIRILGRAE